VTILILIAMTSYLLFVTSIIIKGVLPLTFRQHANEDDESPLLEVNASTLEAATSIQPSEAIEENNDPSQIQAMQDSMGPLDATEQLKREIEVANQNAIGAWKVTLEFIRITQKYVLDLAKLYSSNVYSGIFGCGMDK